MGELPGYNVYTCIFKVDVFHNIAKTGFNKYDIQLQLILPKNARNRIHQMKGTKLAKMHFQMYSDKGILTRPYQKKVPSNACHWISIAIRNIFKSYMIFIALDLFNQLSIFQMSTLMSDKVVNYFL